MASGMPGGVHWDDSGVGKLVTLEGNRPLLIAWQGEPFFINAYPPIPRMLITKRGLVFLFSNDLKQIQMIRVFFRVRKTCTLLLSSRVIYSRTPRAPFYEKGALMGGLAF